MASQTVIQLKYSTTSGNTPVSLANGEIGINSADGILYYNKPNGSLGTILNTLVPGVNKDIIFNDNGVFGASANLLFDKSTSNLAANIVTTGNLNISNQTNMTCGSYTTSSLSQVVIDTSSVSTYRTIKYTIQLTSGTNYHCEDIHIIHNGTTPKITEFGIIYTNSSLGYFDADIVGGNVELLFTPFNSSTTLKFVKTALSI